MNLSYDAYKACQLCPRACSVNRAEGKRGVCAQTDELRIARATLHFWEEPPISGEAGSGTIFFVGCPLGCVYCQNIEISHAKVNYARAGSVKTEELDRISAAVSSERLTEIMLELQAQGALNINLVTGLHFAPHIVRAVTQARIHGLTIPIVANTSGYESPALIRELAQVVDIWLTDFKYANPELARQLSVAQDYPARALDALAAMLENLSSAGGRLVAEDGRMLRGIIVRHLVLPGHIDDSLEVLEQVWELAQNKVDLSVMNQYTPNEAMHARTDSMSRAVLLEEYETVLSRADELGFEHLWWQEGGTVSESFIPAFDLSGVTKPANTP